jgi:hypothetical protein
MKKEDLYKLSDPNFHAELGIMPLWRQDAKVGTNKVILPYYTADQCREILDAVCGCDGWQNEYRGINDMMFCEISIYVDDNSWICKADAGGGRKATKNLEGADLEGFEAKTAATSAFVRAAKAWGIGRHLRMLPQMLMAMDGNNVKTPKGQVLSTPDELTAYCNSVSTSEGWLYQVYRANKPHFDGNERGMQLLADLKTFVKSLKAE